jgi:hypothetical protein
MRVRGLDFSSAKDRPFLPLVEGYGEGNRLDIDEITIIRRHDRLFAAPKRQSSHEVVLTGYDFPFGQSVELADRLGMPKNWNDFVLALPEDREEWKRGLDGMRSQHKKGEKECKRQTDSLHRAAPASKTGRPAVGMMYWYGVKLLLGHEEPIFPVRAGDLRLGGVLEAYPAVFKRTISKSPSVGQILERLARWGVEVGPAVLEATRIHP